MTYLSKRFLIVFSYRDEVEEQIQHRIKHYQKMIQRSRERNSDRTQYFLLYVAPHQPNYVLRSAEVFQYIADETDKNKEILGDLGIQLGIKADNQFYFEGGINLQAWFLAKQLKIDKVFGYSKGFIKFLNACKSIQYSWSQLPTFKKKLVKKSINRI